MYTIIAWAHTPRTFSLRIYAVPVKSGLRLGQADQIRGLPWGTTRAEQQEIAAHVTALSTIRRCHVYGSMPGSMFVETRDQVPLDSTPFAEVLRALRVYVAADQFFAAECADNGEIVVQHQLEVPVA